MRYITILIILCSINLLNAQKGGFVSGKVIEESSSSPLEFATISIFTAQDSSLVSGSITDEDGSFKIAVGKGQYYAQIEFIGFSTVMIADVNINKTQKLVDLGIIRMAAGGIALDQIEITAEKSELQFALDKRVFNVGKDLSSMGGNAQDILDNIPSVSVGVEGEVELRGSSNVRILVNGRPSGLVGIGDNDGLRSIPAHLIERVEVITNPSSKFEAEGMAGIINIILKKDNRTGFNGSFEVSGGLPTQYGAGANVNYRHDKINWFLNYNYRHREGPGTGSKYQEFYGEGITNVSLQEMRRERSGDNQSVRFGGDYYLSDKQVLTGAFLYRYGLDDNLNYVNYRDTSILGLVPSSITSEDIDSYIKRTDDEREEEPILEYSLRYAYDLGKKHKLNADVSYQHNNESESSLFDESSYRKDLLIQSGILEQRSSNDEGQNQWRLQLDYERPLPGNMTMQSGVLGTFRNISNDYKVETKEENEWVNVDGLSNNFIYDENILAGYGSLGQQLDKFSYQLGLRYEYSDINTELKNTQEVNPRSYSNLFPSAFVNYKLAGNNSIQASYSKRIRRPRFWDLNPFFTFTDRRNFFSGNPNLDPEFTNSFEVGHLKYWDNANIGTTVYYRHTRDLIQRIQTDDIVNQTTTRIPQNIGTEDNYGIEFIFAYTGIKWMKIDGSINGYQFFTNGTSEDGQDLSADDITLQSSLNTKVSFWQNADLQLRLNYRAPRNTVQGSRKSMTMVNVALSKDFLDDKLTATLSVRDLFNNRRRRTIYDTPLLYQESDFQWRPRTFNASLTYRVNMKKQRRRTNREYDGGGDF